MELERLYYPNGALYIIRYDDHSTNIYAMDGWLRERMNADTSFEIYDQDGEMVQRVDAEGTLELYNDGVLKMRRRNDGVTEHFYPTGELESIQDYQGGSGCRYYKSGSLKEIFPAHDESSYIEIQEFDDEKSIQARCRLIKEELVAAAFHPRRVETWLEIGGQDLLDMMFGA